MLPVTIKNNQYTNTLWLIQGVLCAALLLNVLLSLLVDIKYMAVLPLWILAIGINHRTIDHQKKHQFKLKSCGQMLLLTHDAAGKSVSEELVVDGYWQIPHALVIKLHHLKHQHKIHLTVFRSVIGEVGFSNLLFGISQTKRNKNEYDES